jgi:hypothetical protein
MSIVVPNFVQIGGFLYFGGHLQHYINIINIYRAKAKYFWHNIYYSKLCLSWTPVGSAFQSGIDRWSDYTGIICKDIWYWDLTSPRKKIWIYWSQSNPWIYFYIHVVVKITEKNYWSEQSFTGLGPEGRCSLWGQLNWITVYLGFVLDRIRCIKLLT